MNLALLAAAALASQPLAERDVVASPAEVAAPVTMTAAQLFAYADSARDRGDFETAERAYLALGRDADPELRTEARFRLARMLSEQMDRPRDAARLLRRILDEKPDAARVRLELARIHAKLGNLSAAQRELRAVQAGALPPEVERLVRFYATALSARKRFGGSVQIALAPSNNVNRATSSDTLGTVIGDFKLDESAKATSGIGLSVRGQGYFRQPLGAKTDLLIRTAGQADIYRQERFSDLQASLQAGPQWRIGSDRLALAATAARRWYGMKPYSRSHGMSGNWQHPLGGRSQLRVDASALHEDNRRNDLQDGMRFTLAAGVDHAFSPRTGGGLQVHGAREQARDPGYSTASGGLSTYLFREIGRTTAVLTASYRHLEADHRLFLFPRRRIDDNFSLSLSGTFRALTVGTFAPLMRIRYERNRSSVGIYDFNRLAAEFGVVAAF